MNTPRKFLAAALLALIAVSPAMSEGNRYSKDGFFIGLSGYRLSPGGDLDKGLVLWHFEKAFFIPKMQKATGFALGFGYKKSSALWELAYLRSSHKTNLPGAESESTFNSIEVSGRIFLLKYAPIQPYVLFGISIPWIQVRNGSQLYDTTSNATYYGMGLNLGGGITINLLPRLFISGGVVYRYLGFLYVSGEGKGRDINDLRVGYGGPEWGKLLRTQSLGLAFGMGFTF
jgi:hypothetical protein